MENPPPKLATFDTKVQRFSKGLATLLKMAPPLPPSLPEKKQSFRMLPDDPLYRAPPNWAKFSVKLQLLRVTEELAWMTIAPPFSATFRMKEQLVITG